MQITSGCQLWRWRILSKAWGQQLCRCKGVSNSAKERSFVACDFQIPTGKNAVLKLDIHVFIIPKGDLRIPWAGNQGKPNVDSPVEVTLSCHDQESLDEGAELKGNSFEQLEAEKNILPKCCWCRIHHDFCLKVLPNHLALTSGLCVNLLLTRTSCFAATQESDRSTFCWKTSATCIQSSFSVSASKKPNSFTSCRLELKVCPDTSIFVKQHG